MLIIPTFLGVYTLLMTKTRGAIIGVLIGGVLLAALLYSRRIVKLSATPLRNRPHMVFCSQGTS